MRVAKWWSTGRIDSHHQQSLSFRFFHLHKSYSVLVFWNVLIHQLNDLKTKKIFTKAFKDKHVKKHPAITCVAAEQRESTDQDAAVFNVSSGMPELATSLCAFKHSIRTMNERTWSVAKNLHSWSGGQCSFHPGLICSCGNCENHNLQASRMRANTVSHVSSMPLGMRSSVKIEPPTQCNPSNYEQWAFKPM